MDYYIKHELNDRQINTLHELFKRAWWTKHRKLVDIKKMLVNTPVVIGLCETEQDELIGFCRVITDYVYKGVVLDVIVHEQYRGQQLGRLLMDEVIQHPDLKSVQHLDLYCLPEMVPFYEKWGFTEGLGESKPMRLKQSK